MQYIAIGGLTLAPIFAAFLMEPWLPLGHWGWAVMLLLALLPSGIYWRRAIGGFVRTELQAVARWAGSPSPTGGTAKALGWAARLIRHLAIIAFVFLFSFTISYIIPTYINPTQLAGAYKVLYAALGSICIAISIMGIISIVFSKWTLKETWQEVLILSYVLTTGTIMLGTVTKFTSG